MKANLNSTINGRHLAWLLIFSLGILYTIALFALYSGNDHPVSASDFNVYYRGATRLIQNQPLYTNLNSNDYVGPSLIIQLLAPLVRLDNYSLAINIWLGISLLASFATVWLISDLFTRERDKIALWLFSFFLFPTFLAIWIGQFSVILTFALVLAWWLYRRGYLVVAGIIIGISIWTKFFPALLVVYFAWKYDWQTVMGAVIGTLGAILFQIAGTGLPTFLEYYTYVLPSLALEGQPLFAAANHAVLGFAQKTFLTVPNGIPLVESNLLMNLTRYGLTALLIGTLCYLTFSHKRGVVAPQERFDLEYMLTLAVALLLGSTLGYYGIQAALPLIAVIWWYTPRRFYTSLWLLLALLLINFNLMLNLGSFRLGSETRMSWLLLSTPFFGMMILWGWLVVLLRGKRWTS